MSKANGAPLQRVESFQWPAAHVGHLNESQQIALQRFKALCQQKGYYHPGDNKTSASHDDETLLRYLRARKFVPQDAFVQFKDTEDWRQENHIDQLYETIDVDEYEATRRLYPQWTGRRDKRGIPFYIYEVGNLDAKDVNAYANDKDRKKHDGPALAGKTPRKMLRLFALYENLCRFVLPLSSVLPGRPNSESPISQSSNVVDLSHVGFKQIWNLRTHMGDASSLATAHYPETLDRIFVVGAPGFFPTIWGWAKKWFDPITVSKIFILSEADTLPTLQKFVDIENIPKKYGGKLDWSFGDMPSLEPTIADALIWQDETRQKGHRTFPIGPVKWQYQDNGDMLAVAIGTEKGQPRHRPLASIRPDSGVARLALSPGRAEESAHAAAIAGASTDSPAAAARSANKPLTNGSAAGSKMNSNPNLNTGKTPNSAVADTSRAGIYTVPLRDSKDVSTAADTREGTSHTRYAQQEGGHAEGTMAAGTPEMRTDGQGSKHAVMEPRTIGQAPKDTPLYRETGHEDEKTLVEQAQVYAEVAYEQVVQLPAVVLGAVGLGGKKEEAAVEEKGKKEDPRIDGLEDKHVEEFIRSRTTSMAQRAKK